jgi:hypothetical protein
LWGTVGYGYRPWLAIAWLVALTVLGTLVVGTLPRTDFVSSSSGVSFNPLLYTVDMLLPIIDISQNKVIPHGAAVWVTFALVAIGWVPATAVIAAFTNVLRRGD